MSSLQHFTKHPSLVKAHHNPCCPSHSQLQRCYMAISGFKHPCTDQRPCACCWPAARLFPHTLFSSVSRGCTEVRCPGSILCSQRRVQSYNINPFSVFLVLPAPGWSGGGTSPNPTPPGFWRTRFWKVPPFIKVVWHNTIKAFFFTVLFVLFFRARVSWSTNWSGFNLAV